MLHLWERLYLPPAPGDVPCKGVDPWLFEIDYRSGVNVMRREGNRPTEPYRDRIGVALRYCATCPLAVRAWCLDAVRPNLSGFSGVAGGVVWSNGRRVWDVDRQQRLEGEAA